MRGFTVLAASVWLSSLLEAQATSIVAVISQTSAVLGADSKVHRGDFSETWSACKIGSANNVFWGKSRILEIPQWGFSVDRIAGEAMSHPGSVSDKVGRFENLIVPPMTKIVNALKAGSYDWYMQNYEGKTALEIVFIGLSVNTPYLHTRYFTARSNPLSGIVSLETGSFDCPGINCGDIAFTALGFHEVVEVELSRNPAIWGTLGLAGSVRHLIEAEIAAVPSEVGPPIAIVEINKDGAHWVSEGQCIAR